MWSLRKHTYGLPVSHWRKHFVRRNDEQQSPLKDAFGSLLALCIISIHTFPSLLEKAEKWHCSGHKYSEPQMRPSAWTPRASCWYAISVSKRIISEIPGKRRCPPLPGSTVGMQERSSCDSWEQELPLSCHWVTTPLTSTPFINESQPQNAQPTSLLIPGPDPWPELSLKLCLRGTSHWCITESTFLRIFTWQRGNFHRARPSPSLQHKQMLHYLRQMRSLHLKLTIAHWDLLLLAPYFGKSNLTIVRKMPAFSKFKKRKKTHQKIL
jgi:hypothetical protein